MPKFLRTKTFVIGAILAALIGLYAILGFVVAPKLIRNALLEDIPKSIDAKPAVGQIRVNPFLMQVEVNDFSLADRAGDKLLGFGRFFIDFQLSSLWNRAYTFVAIDLTAPFVNAIVSHDGQMNLMQLKPKPTPPKPDEKPKKDGDIPPVRIKDFKVTQGSVSYDDRSRPSDFAARLEPINFELQDFTTGADGGRFSLTGASKLGEKFEWHGHLSVQPVESDGEFQIDGLEAHTIWEYLADQLNFVVNSGKLDVNATYQFSLKDTTNLMVDVSKVSLTDLKVAPKGSAGDWVTLPELLVSETKVDLGKRQAQVDSVKLSGLALDAWRQPDGSLNLLQLAAKPGATPTSTPAATTPDTNAPAPPTPDARAPAPDANARAATTPDTNAPAPPMPDARARAPSTPDTNAPAPAANVRAATTPDTNAPAPPTPDANAPAPTANARAATTPGTNAPAPPMPDAKAAAAPQPAWVYSVREVALDNADIKVEDRSVNPAVKVEIAPLNVKVNEISADMGRPVRLAVDARINKKGSLTVEGDVAPQPVAANLKVKLDDLDIAIAQPYIAQKTSMTLRSGELGADTEVHYGASRPAIRVAGNINVTHLHTVDNALHDDFINWDRLDIKGLTYEQDPDRLDINEIVARKAYARVIIEPDTSINVKRVLAGPGATVTVPAQPGDAATETATASVPEAPAPKKASGKKSKARTAVRTDSRNNKAAAAPSMPIAVKKIQFIDSQTNFADLSIKPNFATGIQNLEGTILGLSSKAGTRAKVDLKGAVDKFSPVTIKGEVNALSAVLYTDMGMSFENIELSTFNPYSGKFAGYNIAKGKLTTDLHYKVDGRKLDAQHHIKVDQLEFGDKTESKDAVSLPIKLAVALIKDRNGVIDLDLPVTGSLDDPKFRLGPIIWKVFVNILEKAVTAPFALIGSLFGGGPDLQFVDFEPGHPDLDPAGTDKAHTIAKALDARPQLKIEVPIAIVAELDRPQIIEQRYQQKLRETQEGAAGGKSAKKQAQTAATPFDQLEPDAKLTVLSRLYQSSASAQAKGEPTFPDEITGIKVKTDQVNAKIDYLTKEIHSRIAVDDNDLRTLGQQRAQNLQAALLADGKIAPERVFLVANDKAKNDGGKVRLELSLQ